MKKWYALLMLISSLVQADCSVYSNKQPLDSPMQDPLYLMLSQTITCPRSIQELKKLFKKTRLNEQISMVANRGRNNPGEGSFSFFESVYGQFGSISIHKGELFLGYFTGLLGNTIILDQQPETGKLLIEVIAWDNQKELYNFYELRGMDNRETRWFYRGDSADAYKDNTWLYRENPPDVPHFGNRMRCSACHNSGGPILKELSKPHNDWWTVSRPLLLEPNQPDEEVQAILQQVIDADLLADDVNTGSLKLEASSQVAQIKKELSLQEQLRPLFCTTEINLESNLNLSANTNSIPSSFWINPLLGHINVAVAPADYLQLLQDFDIHFPETAFRDADHGWLTPVKGQSDIRAIRNLINNNQITSDFAKAVLMIDFIHPVFSSQRCELLKLLPERANEGWETQFLTHLQLNSAHFESASLLADYLSIEGNNKILMDKIEQYKQYLDQVMNSSAGLRMSYQYLIELRKSVALSELSQNPLGQILEPGFRVIFPETLRSEATA